MPGSSPERPYDGGGLSGLGRARAGHRSQDTLARHEITPIRRFADGASQSGDQPTWNAAAFYAITNFTRSRHVHRRRREA